MNIKKIIKLQIETPYII